MNTELFKSRQIRKGWIVRQHPNSSTEWALLTKVGKRSYSIKDGRYWRMGCDLSYLFKE